MFLPMTRFLGVASSRNSLCCIGQIIWSAFCKNIINELFSFSVNFHCNSPNFLLHQLIMQKSISIESKQFGVCRFFALRAIYVISAITIQPITWINRLCIHPNTRVILLQIFSIKGSRIFFPFKHYQERICLFWMIFPTLATICRISNSLFLSAKSASKPALPEQRS